MLHDSSMKILAPNKKNPSKKHLYTLIQIPRMLKRVSWQDGRKYNRPKEYIDFCRNEPDRRLLKKENWTINKYKFWLRKGWEIFTCTMLRSYINWLHMNTLILICPVKILGEFVFVFEINAGYIYLGGIKIHLIDEVKILVKSYYLQNHFTFADISAFIKPSTGHYSHLFVILWINRKMS